MDETRKGKRRIRLNDRGDIDKNVVLAMTLGHCHSLALAINDLMAYPITTIVDPKDAEEFSPSHCCVKLPDGDTLDIIGRKAVERAEMKWGKCLIFNNVPPEQVLKFWGYLRPRPEIVKPFAVTLLKQTGLIL